MATSTQNQDRAARRGHARRPAGRWLLLPGLLLAAGLAGAVAAPGSTATTPVNLPPLIRSALAQHPAVQAAQSASDAAQSAVTGARWQFFPTPSVSVEQADTRDPAYAGDPRVVTLGLQQPLWTGGRLTGEFARAQAGVDEGGAALAETRQTLALRVIQAFGDWQAAALKADAYARSAATHARLLAQVQRRAEEGVSALSDIALAESRHDGVQAEWQLAQAQAAAARARLATLVARPLPADTQPVADELPALPDPAAADRLVAMALDTDPLLRRQQARATAVGTEVRLARSQLAPEVYVRAERQHGDFFTPDRDPQTRIFLGATTRFGPGLANRSAITGAQHRHDAALDDVQTQRLAVEAQVRSDAELLLAARARSEFLARTVDSSGQILASWERQFLAGRKQWQDVMNAARELAQAEAQLADATASTAVVAWRLAVQCRGLDAVLGNPDSAPSDAAPPGSTSPAAPPAIPPASNTP